MKNLTRTYFPDAYCKMVDPYYEIWATVDGVDDFIGVGITMDEAWESAELFADAYSAGYKVQ